MQAQARAARDAMHAAGHKQMVKTYDLIQVVLHPLVTKADRTPTPFAGGY